MGKNENANRGNNFKMIEDAAKVYGALFGLQLTDVLSLGAVFSYGTGWKCKSDYIFYSGTVLHMYRTMDKTQRYEGDITCNYRLNNYFKIFFGWKYIGFRADGEYDIYIEGGGPLGEGTFNIESDLSGPGLGLTLKLNLDDNLFFITTLSGIYMREKVETDINGYSNKTTDEDYNWAGPNATLNFTYAVPDTSASISLGGRYQYLIKLDEHSKNLLYGVMLTAIYSF